MLRPCELFTRREQTFAQNERCRTIVVCRESFLQLTHRDPQSLRHIARPELGPAQMCPNELLRSIHACRGGILRSLWNNTQERKPSQFKKGRLGGGFRAPGA